MPGDASAPLQLRPQQLIDGSFCRSRFVLDSLEHLRRQNLAEVAFQQSKKEYKRQTAIRKELAPDAEDSLQLEEPPSKVIIREEPDSFGPLLDGDALDPREPPLSTLEKIEKEMREIENRGEIAQRKMLAAELQWAQGMRDLTNTTWKRGQLEKRKAEALREQQQQQQM